MIFRLAKKNLAASLFAWGALLFAAIPVAVAAEETDAGGYTSESAEERTVREIAKDLRCAVCQNESVADSNSQLARNMRQLIRDQVQEGKSESEIRAYFVSRYGDYILMEPRKEGYNLVLWAFPFAALLIGSLLVTLRFVKRGSATVVGGHDVPSTQETDELIRRLRETPDDDSANSEKKE